VTPPEVNAPAALEHVDVIAGEIRRLDEVVQGFLKFTRPEDLKLQPVKLAVLFDEVVPIVRPEADRTGVTLEVDCDSVPDVNGDPAMLRQAFLNLALNACQAMPEGGTLRIRCETARHRRVAVNITDTGVGIKPEHLQRIFDLYFTTKAKGSGIGLSMVYRTVQMHDGEIEVQSIPGKGTTFRILLPQAS
jgi:signal transduction histidine kinase